MGASDDALTILSDGRRVGTEELVSIVYENLRRIADSMWRRESEALTLQPTALVHEAYLRLADREEGWENRAQFLAVAGNVMRRVLVDAARARKSLKRGGDRDRVTLLDDSVSTDGLNLDILDFDAALERLGQLNPRFVQIVDMHFFGGLTLKEVAQHLGISRTTTVHEWSQARAWLSVELGLPPES